MMNLDNDSVNRLILRNKARPSFSATSNMAARLKDDGTPKINCEQMPLVHALEVLIETAVALHPDAVHPGKWVGIQVSTSDLFRLALTLVRGVPLQSDVEDDDPEQMERKIAEEVTNAHGAHKTAAKILSDLARVEAMRVKKEDKFTSKDEYTMDKFVKELKNSPHPEFTKTLLSTSGPESVKWISPRGPLDILETEMKPALMAEKTVEVMAKVLFVREKQGVAYLEIQSAANDYSKTVLCHFNGEVELKFNSDSSERDDLLLLQYLKATVLFKVSAVCAIHQKFSKKTVLTLKKIVISRSKMNELHNTVHQFPFPFEPAPED